MRPTPDQRLKDLLKKTQEDLRRSQEKFKALIENSWDGVLIVDKNGIILYAPTSLGRVLNHNPEDVVGKPMWGFLHEDEKAELTAAFEEILKRPEDIRLHEFRVRHADGSWRTLEGMVRNLLANPYIGGIVINYHDVTARRLAEDHLIESERKHRLLVSTLSEGVWSCDQDGRTTFVPPPWPTC
jgi:PAS domain S-box-containing protein